MLETKTIAIIDYDMGNIKSIENAVNQIGNFNILVTSKRADILNSDIIILPGVGAFPDAMKKLSKKKLIPVLDIATIQQKKPILGICLGMQLLFERSDEKEVTAGLNYIPGEVKYIKPRNGLRVPHIGWNSLEVIESDSILGFLQKDKDFYFVHSLHAVCDDKFVIAKVNYGNLVVAAVKNDNVIGMQFHPEKSQKNGLLALKHFFAWAEKYIENNKYA